MPDKIRIPQGNNVAGGTSSVERQSVGASERPARESVERGAMVRRSDAATLHAARSRARR